MFVGGCAFVDIRLAPAQQPVNQRGQLSGGSEHRNISAQPLGELAIVGSQGGAAVTQRERCHAQGSRHPRARTVPLFLFEWFAPLLGTRGAKVMWATNSFSVGKRLRSGPYSLSTTSTVSTPMASICVISTPLMRYSACRFASCPRLLMALALLALFRGGAVSLRCPGSSISSSCRRISCS